MGIAGDVEAFGHVVFLLVLRVAARDGLLIAGGAIVPQGGIVAGNPRIALIEEVHGGELAHLLTVVAEELQPDAILLPVVRDLREELLAMVLVLEVAQSGIEGLGIAVDLVLVVLGFQQCPDEVAQVVEVLAAVLQLRWQQDGDIVTGPFLVPLALDVFLWNGNIITVIFSILTGIEDVDPVALALVGFERGAHAHPVVTLFILHHVAQAVVGGASKAGAEESVETRLLMGAVDDLLQVGNELRVDRDLGEVLCAGLRGCPLQLAHAGLVDGQLCIQPCRVYVGQCAEFLLGLFKGAHHHEACVGIVLRGHADGGLVGLRLPVVCQFLCACQYTEPAPGSMCLLGV